MTRAILFANGELAGLPAILQGISPGDLVIAADGGTHHCQKLGITPHAIIGDFDSLDAEVVESYEHMGVVTMRYPAHKDETDLELALQYAQKEGVDDVYIAGGLGARWDMTVANILLMVQARFTGMKIHLVDGAQELSVLRGGEKAEFGGKAGCTLSLVPLGGDCRGVRTHGLEYPLADETLYFGSPRGVSNVLLGEQAQVELSEGTLLCILNGGSTD